MNWVALWRKVITVIVIAVTSALKRDATATAADCPDHYWDELSKRCARPIISTLERLCPLDALATNWTLTDRSAINRTCTSWTQTNACYRRLLSRCQSHARAHAELAAHLRRFALYAATCSESDYRRRRHLISCFIPLLKPTMTCTEAFDRYFRNYVADKQYRNACRVVSTAMRCFHEIQSEINVRCPVDGPAEYQRTYILPLIEQTRATVLDKCDMSPTYQHYFVSGSPPTPPGERRRRTTAAAVAAAATSALVAFLLARWPHVER